MLQELALAVGTSLDGHANSEHFVRTVMARKDLAHAAVWLVILWLERWVRRTAP